MCKLPLRILKCLFLDICLEHGKSKVLLKKKKAHGFETNMKGSYKGDKVRGHRMELMLSPIGSPGKQALRQSGGMVIKECPWG